MKHRKNYTLPASLSSSSSSSPSPTSPSSSDSVSAPEPLDASAFGSKGREFAGPGEWKLRPKAKDLVPLTSAPEFVELLARSNFSFLQGASHPEEMVLMAKRLEYRGLAICDVNGLYGVVRGYQAAEKPSSFDAEQLEFAPGENSSKAPFHYMCGSELTPYDSSPVVLLPMNKDGYVRLCHLITFAKRKAPKGHIVLSLKDICEKNDDLIAFPLPPWKEDHLKRLQTAFQDRIYLPVHKDFTWESIRTYQQAMKYEESLGILAFATGRPLFHDAARKPLHDVLTCILHKTTVQEAGTHLTLNRERYMKTPEQLGALFRERPELLRRTLEIASRVTFSLAELRYKYPQEHLPMGKTAAEHLRDLVEKGLRDRYGEHIAFAKSPDAKEALFTTVTGKKRTQSQMRGFLQGVRKQVEHELAIIGKMEYEDYFLTLYEICDFATRQGILHQGRGSAANSVVCYALKLTAIDPLELGLLFERFISTERGEPPDIDIDFEHARREEVIQHIYAKYGDERAAMVCTVICYRSRMAIREVAKVMGVPLKQVDALIKFMGREGLSRLVDEYLRPHAHTADDMTHGTGPEKLDHGHKFDLAKIGLSPQQFQKLLRLSLELQGFPRHLGIHSGGFVISHEPVIDIVPVETASMNQRYVIQWNKDDIATLGLMKVDVLSLGMLTAVMKCLELLRAHKGIDWDLSRVPQEDKPTYDMIQKADTVGVFQIESRAQMSLLPRLRPKTYYDLVIQIAIVRPGPIQGGMVHPYLKRRAGEEKVTYAHESLRPILQKTLGIPLFQEQIMQIAVSAAGFTPGESDELRRVVSSAWKKKAVMEGLRQRVINGMLANNISREYAEQIYKTIEGFSSYGFPESHSASFALLCYVSCYMKRHHPDVFACALLNSQPMGFYSPRQLVADAQRHGVKFQALDVQASEWDYVMIPPRGKARLPSYAFAKESATHGDPRVKRVEVPSNTPSRLDLPSSHAEAPMHDVRVGFCSVWGVREDHIRILVDERNKNGFFEGISDLVRRTKLPKSALLRLAAAGAFASFGFSAREALWVIQGLSFDDKSLFFGSHTGLDDVRQIEEARAIPEESDWQSVHREYATKGFSLDSHPLSILRPELSKSKQRYTRAEELSRLRGGSSVRVAGLMSLLQKPPTAKGMCFVTIEDETGLINLIVTPDMYEKFRLVLMSERLLEVEGIVQNRSGVINIQVRGLKRLLENPALIADRDASRAKKLLPPPYEKNV